MTDTFRIRQAKLKELYDYPNGFTTTGQIPTAGAEVNRFVFAHDSEATTVQNDPRFTRSFATDAATHQVLLGLDAHRYRLDEKQSFALGTPLNPVTPDYRIPQPAVGAPYIDVVRVQEQIGIYAQDQIPFGDGWIATVNGRNDKVW